MSPRLAAVLLLALPLEAQTAPDSGMADAIAKIKAIDNHAHPLRFVDRGEKPDDEYDALPCDALEQAPPPVRLRTDNPEYISAWSALYAYPYKDASQPHIRDLLQAKDRMIRERGPGYPYWVLDQLGIETMLANRVALGRGLEAPRFRWVPFVDALMFPLNNQSVARENPDYRAFYASEERLLKRYLSESKLSALPATLEEYLKHVVTPTLERQKRAGALAVKFEAAYLRTLSFAEVPESEAKRIYAQYVKGGVPSRTDYKMLQDFLFRYIAREAGRLGLAVHIHTGVGCGTYFKLDAANPLRLEPLFNDPGLRKTNFVIVHGGWPYHQAVAALLEKTNVYADFSALTLVLYPRALSEVLRTWLEWFPEKVLFGTDVFAVSPEVGWEETGWLAANSSRRALTLALTGMINDGEITRDRALEIARMVFRDNATRLYKLGDIK